MSLLQTWRWYGPDDPVTLQDIKQAGAKGIVTALHHIPHGEVWPVDEIQKRKSIIESAGFQWSVVESVPVHEAIKTRQKDADVYIENYRKTLRNLASCDIKTVCYNFMPVLDWTRTKLDYELTNGAKALYFNWVDLTLFDLFILKRENAEASYSKEVIEQAEKRFQGLTVAECDRLAEVILMGIPNEKGITLNDLRQSIRVYEQIGHEELRENLVYFLSSIAEVCEQEGIVMTIHPDDPPYPILGLPRIVSTKEDFSYIYQRVNQEFNGFCFCTGSLSASRNMEIAEIFDIVKDRVYFAHLRTVLKDKEGNFYEADHLAGDVDMYEVMKRLLIENNKRSNPIPFRPDHGHQMLDDLAKVTNPGYSAIGRLKGLAELRGLEAGILGSFKNNL
ncbi:MAG: mannonate dehydratase [Sphingobacterium sp.]